ncbi:hypothetical protein DYBT9275_01044 [Dyadobacter sp. CECT 9275]|uniref:Endonuclease/exonuclease/phosphatase domain-containing protein n=1 Tax=Dyadobacter helix TaxID=2822344 RepID=A0A916NB94_9BACT|nr:endonuclease/exonuclease/phosphatase family protein [Dyadobacter sp. CECT 9275]CAG4992811.1 hypothetical protein DYBT9275_01044 [Dyadobacter sp. CECT 9275]
MKTSVCYFVLFSFLILTGFTVSSDREIRKKFLLKVMTYNIHHCNPPGHDTKIDVEAIARVINSEKPDLVALQEVDVNTERSGKGKNQAKQLAEATGMHYYFSKAIDHGGGDYGVAILSRFPILDSVRYALPVHADMPEELRTVAAVTVLLPDHRKLLFASTHLGLKEPNRLLQAERIVSAFEKNDLPMIIGGDFNAVPESSVMKYLNQHFSRTCALDCKPTIPVELPDKAIDFILYKDKKHFRVKSTRVIEEKYASDHLPVTSELEVLF